MWSRSHPSLATAVAAGIFLVAAAIVALGLRQRRENERVAKLHGEFVELVRGGKEALEQRDERTAKEKFLSALSMVLGEPALYEQEGLGVRGWLDNALRDGEENRWKSRPSPVLFNERRDRAFLLSLVVDPHQPKGVEIIRQAIRDALAMTIANDPAWRVEREQLVLVEADLLLRNGDAASALAVLDETKGVPSKLWHDRRSHCLQFLGRKAEADRERSRAEQLAPNEGFEFFLNGIDHFHRQEVAAAFRDFEKVLTREPDHFSGRFFQAACFLMLKRPGEAKVALTACIGRRPRFLFSYLFRGQACVQLGEYANAAQDFQTALETNPDRPAREYLDGALVSLESAVRILPINAQKAIGNETIRTDSGPRPLREILHLQKLDLSVRDE